MQDNYIDRLAKETALRIFFPGATGEIAAEHYDDNFKNKVLREDQLKELEHIATTVKNALMLYSGGIHRGTIVSMINGHVPANANEWNMDLLATIGFNTSCEFKIKGVVFKFNPKSCAWGGEGLTLPMDPSTGLPMHPTINND